MRTNVIEVKRAFGKKGVFNIKVHFKMLGTKLWEYKEL